MPSSLGQFVKGQVVDNNVDSFGGKDLSRRRAEGQTAKISRKPAKSQPFTDQRNAAPPPSFPGTSRAFEQDDRDIFAGSVLSDSDDTTRDLGSSNIPDYQAMLPTQGSRSPAGSDEGETDSEQEFSRVNREDEERLARLNPDNLRDYPGEEVEQSHAFQSRSENFSIVTPTMENFLRYRDTKKFADAEKLHSSKLDSTYMLPSHPGISGRFTPAHTFAADVHQPPTMLDDAVDVHRKSHPRGNDRTNWDGRVRNDNDENIRRGNLQHEGHAHYSRPELANWNGAATHHRSVGEQEAEDRFPPSGLDDESLGGSSQPSPSQHTPRANGQSSKETPPSSHAGKRKKAALDLDYDENVLFAMKYSELKDQPFDSNPKAPPSIISGFSSGPEASLEDHLEQLKHAELNDQIGFFAQMPLDQWEQSGDWFLERFGDIMSNFKDARRKKREVSKAFEEELATREEAVRVKAEGIQEVFRQMKAGGEGVLRGKMT